MKIGIMDTGVATENSGDLIIMEAAKQALEKILISYQLIYFPTHEKLSFHSYKLQRYLEINVACGTNLLHSHMGIIKQWNIGIVDAFKIKPVVLFGVGWRSQKKRKTDIFTKWLLRKVLSNDYLHSVRDSYTQEQLNSIGIINVINTGCPTTWSLTEEHCLKIPTKKGKNAVVVLTDYSRNEKDSMVLDFVCANYMKVYFWCQGTHDYEYINALGFANKVEIIPSNLFAYRQLLSDESLSLDYVGTRLHGGIYALKNKRRSIIIGVDHRANEMGRDLNLPVIDRKSSDEILKNKIIHDFETRINLPLENIQKWCLQFGNSKNL
jgi:polysaccharide pyruvyl transferase WcaK-like protein